MLWERWLAKINGLTLSCLPGRRLGRANQKKRQAVNMKPLAPQVAMQAGLSQVEKTQAVVVGPRWVQFS